VVGDFQIGIASFGIDYDCKGLNATISIRRHWRWIVKNEKLLEGKVLLKTMVKYVCTLWSFSSFSFSSLFMLTYVYVS
jgi:hypothetical protein